MANRRYSTAAGLGQPDPIKVGRQFRISVNDFGSSEQASPIPAVWGGTARLSGKYIFPIFTFRSEEVRQDYDVK